MLSGKAFISIHTKGGMFDGLIYINVPDMAVFEGIPLEGCYYEKTNPKDDVWVKALPLDENGVNQIIFQHFPHAGRGAK